MLKFKMLDLHGEKKNNLYAGFSELLHIDHFQIFSHKKILQTQ